MTTVDPKNLEILRMAREIVINEHTDRRAEMHNQWLVESNELWRTRRVRLAYPAIPPYPTENDIIARAQKLLEFASTISGDEIIEDSANISATVTEPKVASSTPDATKDRVDEPARAIRPIEETLDVEVPKQDIKNLVTPTPTVQELMDYMKEAKAAEPEPTGILPSLLKKIEEIRGSRNSNAE